MANKLNDQHYFNNQNKVLNNTKVKWSIIYDCIDLRAAVFLDILYRTKDLLGVIQFSNFLPGF